MCFHPCILKGKYYVDKIFVGGCIGSCKRTAYFSQSWQFRQHDISVSIHIKSSSLSSISSVTTTKTMASPVSAIWIISGLNLRTSVSFQATAALREAELQFLRAAELGDIYEVIRIMRNNEDFNVDCVDAMGRTALRLAVRQQHIDVSIFSRMHWNVNGVKLTKVWKCHNNVLLVNGCTGSCHDWSRNTIVMAFFFQLASP